MLSSKSKAFIKKADCNPITHFHFVIYSCINISGVFSLSNRCCCLLGNLQMEACKWMTFDPWGWLNGWRLLWPRQSVALGGLWLLFNFIFISVWDTSFNDAVKQRCPVTFHNKSCNRKVLECPFVLKWEQEAPRYHWNIWSSDDVRAPFWPRITLCYLILMETFLLLFCVAGEEPNKEALQDVEDEAQWDSASNSKQLETPTPPPHTPPTPTLPHHPPLPPLPLFPFSHLSSSKNPAGPRRQQVYFSSFLFLY